MVRNRRPSALLAVAAAALAVSLSACGSGSGHGRPTPAHHPSSAPTGATVPAVLAPTASASQADLLAAARQSARNPAFAHAVRDGDRHWRAGGVRFSSGHFTLRTSCIGEGTVTATVSGIEPWSIRCANGQISVDQITQTVGGRPVDFSFTAAAKVRFAVVAAG